jgi:hypothetical protein
MVSSLLLILRFLGFWGLFASLELVKLRAQVVLFDHFSDDEFIRVVSKMSTYDTYVHVILRGLCWEPNTFPTMRFSCLGILKISNLNEF